MTLEDFFTLTEMKDGLTAPARVEELIVVMKKEKDCIMKNIGDATRQWSAVSSTIAATDNKDCLDLFIQLDGLWFIDRWLKDTQKFDTDASESFVEEAITAMLGALEKLQIDVDRSTSSGILITIKNLMNHSSLRIRDRASALCDRWKQDGSGTDNTIHQGVERVEGSCDDSITVSEKLAVASKTESSALDAPLLKECGKHENSSLDEVLPSISSGGLQTENVEDLQRHAHDNHPNSSALGDKGPVPTCQEKSSSREESQVPTKEGTVSIVSSTSAPEQQSVGQVDVQTLAVSTKDASNSHVESGVRELSAGSNILESTVVQLSVDVANAQESTIEPALQNNVTVGEVEGATLKSETERGVDDMKVPDCSNTYLSKTASQKAESCTLLQQSSGKEHISAIPMDIGTLVSKMEDCESSLRKSGGPCSDTESLDVLVQKRKEDTGSAYEEKEHRSDADGGLKSSPKFSISVKDARSPDITDKKRPDIELDYGTVDALEVARKVAREVQRDAVDDREPSCCSSDKISEGGIAQPGVLDSVNVKEGQTVSTKQNVSPEKYLQEGEHAMMSDHVDTEPENCLPDMESSQVTETVREPEANSESGGMCGFDLNQEICSDGMDPPLDTISTPVSVVPASRPTISPGLPVTPLQFEGTLGWKGSALTSAFRPASTRRISEAGGSSNDSKCRQDRLDFDLNVAEDGEDKFADRTLGKPVHASFGLPCGESFLESSSKKPERLKLDLNCVGEDCDVPSADIRMEGRLFLHQNGRRSPSPASSSSSMQPSMRNFDLNDRPHIQNDSSHQGPFHANLWQNVGAYGGTKLDDPVISIMGTRVEVKRKDFVPQTLSLSNGKAPEFAMDANVARTAAFLGMGPTVAYTHPPAFGYNGYTAGPAMSFSSTMYGAGGSVPYMVDSRGAPVVPQVVGSASSVPPYTQQPFIMSMTSPPPGITGLGPTRPNFDLNSGFIIDGGNRESSSLRQFFIPGQGRSMDEHLRANSLPSSSVVGTKRKEPDVGWEPLSFNYKHQHPPWN